MEKGNLSEHEKFMRLALSEAQKAMKVDEIPVGAVIVHNGRVIARGYNQTEMLNDVTAHAEMIAITAATSQIGGKYLNNCTLYVTLEPCVMCAGAIFWSRISNVVFGTYDPKRGFTKTDPKILHPKTTFIGGILENECAALLKVFFEKKRK